MFCFLLETQLQKTAAQNAHKIILFNLGEYLLAGRPLAIIVFILSYGLSIFCCCFVWCVPYVFFHLKLSSHLYVILLSTSATIIYPRLSRFLISYWLFSSPLNSNESAILNFKICSHKFIKIIGINVIIEMLTI